MCKWTTFSDIHSSVEAHLGYFQLLAIINKAAMNIVEDVSFLLVGKSSGYMPRRGIAGSSSRATDGLRSQISEWQFTGLPESVTSEYSTL